MILVMKIINGYTKIIQIQKLQLDWEKEQVFVA